MAMLQEVCENIKTAIEHGRTDIIRSLIEACDQEGNEATITKEKILNHPFLEEGTFLYLATKLKQGDVVRTLLSFGADPGIQNNRGLNAIDAATTEQMLQIFVDELLRATANSEIERVCQLIEAGININAYDSEDSKNTPLHWAACYGNKDIVVCLIDRDADVNADNSCGATPLHDAVNRDDREVIEELLHNGANPLIKATKGKFAGKTSFDLAINKPELRALMARLSGCNDFIDGNVPLHRPQSTQRKRTTSIDSYNSNNELQPLHVKHEHSPSSGTVQSITTTTSSICNNNFNSSVISRKHSCPPFTSQNSWLDLSPQLDQAIEGLTRTRLSTPVRPLVTHSTLLLLWPQPRSLVEQEGPPFIPQKTLEISIVNGPESIHSILDVWELWRPRLLDIGFDVKVNDVQPTCGRWTESQVECLVNPDLFLHQGAYQIHVNSSRVRISSSTLSGLHYALATFTQMLQLSVQENGNETVMLVPVLIQDQPAMSHRAVMLDISPRGRTPTLEYLFHMIKLWSTLKLSHLHLYTRLLPSNEWQLCFSRREMVTIDRFCKDRFINLIPVLDVDGSVAYQDLTDMWASFQEILATFPDLKYVHIGPVLTNLILRAESSSPSPHHSSIELDEDSAPLQQLWRLLALPQKVTLMLCANSLPQQRQYALPANMVLVQYGFQADYDFSDTTRPLSAQGAMTCLCPGTASWNSLAGCPEATVCNIYRAVHAVSEKGFLGLVIAHWSGSYHLTPHPFSWPGFLVGLGLAWNTDTAPPDYLHGSLAELINTHIFYDSERLIGAVILELGYAETYLLRTARGQSGTDLSELPAQDGSTLYKLLTDPDNVNLEHLTADVIARVTKQLKKCQNLLFRSRLYSQYSEMVIQELQLSIDLMLTACRIGRTLISIGMNPNSNMGLAVINLGICHLPPTFRTDIANKLLAHIEQYKGTWLQRHLPAGLQGSLLVLTSALHRFVPDDAHPP